MSIESMLEKLSLGDESAFVEEVKKNGVEKSGLAANIHALAAKAASKDEKDALPALTTVKALAEGAPDAWPARRYAWEHALRRLDTSKRQ